MSSNTAVAQDFKPNHTSSYRNHSGRTDPRLERYNRGNVGAATKQDMVSEKPVDVFALLKQLQKSGILAKDTTSVASSTVRIEPGTSAVAFDRSLRRRSESVIEALLTSSVEVCKECGLRCNNKANRKQHRENHVQERLGLIRKADTPYWYQTKENWLGADDEISNDSKPSVVLKHVALDENTDAVWSEHMNLECPVCCEKFDTYFDDENDNWKIRNSVLNGQKALHVDCLHDLSLDFGNLSML